MQLLVAMIFGMVCAWAFQKNRGACELGVWRLIAGGLSAGFPHVEGFLKFYSTSIYEGLHYSIFWSPLLAPLFALLIAFVVSHLSRKPFEKFYPLCIGSLFLSILLGLLTSNGVRLFTPFTETTFSLPMLHPFDVAILAIGFVVLSSGYFLRSWRRDLARFGLMVMIAYIGVMASLHLKAKDFAQQYADAFQLEVQKVHVLPQPLSPLNWRLLVETKDQRFHDTRINLFRQEEKEVFEDSTRTARIDAQYKPLSKAIWRIYRRFGAKDTVFAKRAWLSLSQSSEQFQWDAKFAVFKGKMKYEGAPCAQFVDITKLGARSKMRGTYMICKGESGEAVLYRSDKEGEFSKFETMY